MTTMNACGLLGIVLALVVLGIAAVSALATPTTHQSQTVVTGLILLLAIGLAWFVHITSPPTKVTIRPTLIAARNGARCRIRTLPVFQARLHRVRTHGVSLSSGFARCGASV